MTSVELALIGCSGISRAHVDGYEKLDDVHVPAVCDLVADRAREKAARIGEFQDDAPAIFTDFREMLDTIPSIEAVDICTGHASHHEIAIDCLERGKHALVEKPLGITVKASRQIIDAAEANDRILGVGEEARNSLRHRAISWAVDDGAIGEPRTVWWYDAEERLGRWGWRDFKLKAGGGWAFDGGVHYVDRWRDLLGEAQEVYAVTEQFEPVRYEEFEDADWPPGPTGQGAEEVDVEDTLFATIRFDDAVVQWSYSCAAPGKQIGDRVLYGEDGCLDFNGELVATDARMSLEELEEKFLTSINEETRTNLFPAGIEDENPEANNIGDFITAVQNDETPEMDGWEGLRDVAVPMAVYESSRLGEPVRVRDIEQGRVADYQQEINDALDI